MEDSKNNQRKSEESENNQFGDANLFDNEFENLEKEFNQNNKMGSANPFGQSTTKELLAQSRKEIMEEELQTKAAPGTQQ